MEKKNKREESEGNSDKREKAKYFGRVYKGQISSLLPKNRMERKIII